MKRLCCRDIVKPAFIEVKVLLQTKAAPAAKCYVCSPIFEGRGREEKFQNLHFLSSFVFSDFCRIYMPRSCGGLLFPETLNDPQVFLTEVVV